LGTDGIGSNKNRKIVKDWSEEFDKNNNFFNELKDKVPELKLTNEFMNLVLQLAHNDFKTKFFPKLATPSTIGVPPL